MFEAIAANKRRSAWLLLCMALLLAALGGSIGALVESWASNDQFRTPGLARSAPSFETGMLIGVAAAGGIFVILWLTAVTSGESLLLSSARAAEVQKQDAPQLHNIVEEMSIAAGLPSPPRVYVINDASLNAFAVGRDPSKASVAVTAGLLKRLNRDELQGVIAHEIGHIKNYDARFMTLAAVMLGAIVMISRGFLRAMFHGGGRAAGRSSGGKRGGGGGVAIILVIALVLAVVAPFAAQMLYLSCSRRREYLADAPSALFTRYPLGLASALEKISGQGAVDAKGVPEQLRPLYIVNPLQSAWSFSMFSTHPPTPQRIAILRSMAGAGYAAYDAAYREALRTQSSCVGAASRAAAGEVEIRPPSGEGGITDAIARGSAVEALLDRVLPLIVIPCPCGVKLKLPPEYALPTAACPRCSRVHEVPQATPGEPVKSPLRPKAPSRPLEFRGRKAGEWTRFKCTCGGVVELSPTFSATRTRCPSCKTVIHVKE